jgi:hypothetical protein
MASLWTPDGERRVDPAASGGDAGSDLNPDERAELQAELDAMQEQLAQTPASVVVANHAVGLFQLAALHLNRGNLEEGRLAIDAMGGILDATADRLGEEGPALREGLAQLRLAFVALTGGSPAAD